MKNFRKFLIGFVVTLMIAALFYVIAFYMVIKPLFEREAGYERFQKCEWINGRISVEELIAMVGQPHRVDPTQDGDIYYYREAAFAAGPIRIMVDTETNRVAGVKCSEDGQWVYFEEALQKDV